MLFTCGTPGETATIDGRAEAYLRDPTITNASMANAGWTQWGDPTEVEEFSNEQKPDEPVDTGKVSTRWISPDGERTRECHHRRRGWFTFRRELGCFPDCPHPAATQ